MDMSAAGLIKLLLPRAPSIFTTILLNKLSLSKNSSKQDATTEVVVNLLRSVLSVNKTTGYLQHVSCKDPGIKGPLWISKVTIPPPDAAQALLDALSGAIKTLGGGTETYPMPSPAPVEAEWTGYRAGVRKNEPQPEVSEPEKYKSLMSEVSSAVTILYFHGGAYMLMSPASHRSTTSHLAKLTGGRCLSVAYRLAPQAAFPSQLLGALQAYLYLLSPPPDSLHEPVPASSIVFAGDSAGGNLSLALLQLLMTLQRNGITTLPWHGSSVPVALPAGLGLNSPWCDIARVLPSNTTNEQFDYLAAPPKSGQPDEPLPDQYWPTQPPRATLFCNGSMLAHPLASPLAATAEMWKGAPPVWMCCGNEALEDEITVTAHRIHEAGGSVALNLYEGMPHCFAMIFPTSPAGKDCFRAWAAFCVEAVEGRVKREEDSVRVTKAFSKAAKHEQTNFAQARRTKVSDEEVRRLMHNDRRSQMEREDALVRQWRAANPKPHL